MQALLETLHKEFVDTLAETTHAIQRRYTFSDAPHTLHVAVGMWEAGKTHFLFQIMRKLVSENVPLERILYLPLQDERLQPMDHKKLGELIEEWYTLNPDNHDNCCHLFLDDIQHIEGWHLLLSRIMNTKNVQLYVTGSTAKLISKEVQATFKNRISCLEIQPYSYEEHLQAHSHPLPRKPFNNKMFDQQHYYLLDFFQMGGFPAIQALPYGERRHILQSYAETVAGIESTPLLNSLIQTLLKSIASSFSVAAFCNEHKADKEAVLALLSKLEEAFLIFTIPLFTSSEQKRHASPRKVYALDNGLIAANTFNQTSSTDMFLKNQVFIDLRRQGKKMSYYVTATGAEIDFVTQDAQGKQEIVQVGWDPDDLVTRALREAESELRLTGRVIDWKDYLCGASTR